MLISEVKNQRQSVYEYSDRAVDLYNEHEEDSKDISKNSIICDSNKSHQSIEMNDRNRLTKEIVRTKNSQRNPWHKVRYQDSENSKPQIFNSPK